MSERQVASRKCTRRAGQRAEARGPRRGPRRRGGQGEAHKSGGGPLHVRDKARGTHQASWSCTCGRVTRVGQPRG